MKTIVRILEDKGCFFISGLVDGEAKSLGPYESLNKALDCLVVKEGDKSKSKQKKSTKKTDTGTESSK